MSLLSKRGVFEDDVEGRGPEYLERFKPEQSF